MATPTINKNMSIRNLLFSDMRWRFGATQVKAKLTNRSTGKVTTKTICMSIQKPVKMPISTHNNYDAIESDELVAYGDYRQPWKLDSGASGHYCGRNTGVRKRRAQRNGIQVQVADGKSMNQVEEGKAPFDGMPEDAADVEIFQHMPNALCSAGKIVKQNHKIILDDPIAPVINKATNEVVMEAKFDHRTSTWDIYPDGPVPYEFKKGDEVEPLGLGMQQQQTGGYVIHFANNAY